jgi:hypothetical protein
MTFSGRILGSIGAKESFLSRTCMDNHGLAFHPKLLMAATPNANDIVFYQSSN